MSPDQEKRLFDAVKTELVQKLMTESRDDMQLLTPVQVCGLLNISQPTLTALKDGPPRVTIVAGTAVRYRACDVSAYIQRRMEKKAGKL